VKSLDSSYQDESNDGKIIPIGAIFAEIAIFAKFQVGSDRVNCLTRPEFSGRVGSGTRISGKKCGALILPEVARHRNLYNYISNDCKTWRSELIEPVEA